MTTSTHPELKFNIVEIWDLQKQINSIYNLLFDQQRLNIQPFYQGGNAGSCMDGINKEKKIEKNKTGGRSKFGSMLK